MRYGLQKYLDYYQAINPARFSDLEGRDPVEVLTETRRAVIGTPDDAIEQIQRLRDKQGEFGCYLQLAHNWANWEATKKSYELYARHVVPHFRGSNAHRASSNAWAYEHRMEFSTLRDAATKKMLDQHEAEPKDIEPDRDHIGRERDIDSLAVPTERRLKAPFGLGNLIRRNAGCQLHRLT